MHAHAGGAIGGVFDRSLPHSVHTTKPNGGVLFCTEIVGVKGGTHDAEPGSTTGRSTLPPLYCRLSSVNKWETILHTAAIDCLR